MRPPVQKRGTPRAFSPVSTGDSDYPSSCELKDEPAFKPLQGNPAFFSVRASRGPFHLRQKISSPLHIPIAEVRLLIRCMWKVGLTLQSKTGIHSYPKMIWGAHNFPQVAVLKLMILYIEAGVSVNIWSFLKGVKPLVLYDLDHRMNMEPMEGKLASSQFDLEYTELFCITEVTSVFF